MGNFDVGSLNVVDILILVIFFLSVIIGFGRGLVSEVVSLVTLIAAFVVAILFTNTLATFVTNTAAVHDVVSQTTTATGVNTAQPVTYMALAVCFGALFFATVIVGWVVKMLLNLIFNTGVLGFGNRILGGVFGFARGYLINLVLIFLVQLSPLATQSWWQQSQYVPKFQPQVVWLGAKVSPVLANLKNTFGTTVQNGVSGAVQSVTDAVQNVSDTIKK